MFPRLVAIIYLGAIPMSSLTPRRTGCSFISPINLHTGLAGPTAPIKILYRCTMENYIFMLSIRRTVFNAYVRYE